jgi:uncharacterized protein
MTAHLLDVNVLVALLWPAHEAHEKAQNWFKRNAKAAWATCAFTQAAVVRILSNPAFSPDALTVEEAIRVLRANVEHPTHQFWIDDISFIEATKPFRKRVIGHQQVTDAYLLGLAMHRKGKLVTMDRSVLALLPEGDPGRSTVAMI